MCSGDRGKSQEEAGRREKTVGRNDHVKITWKYTQNRGMDKKSASESCQKDRGVSKRDIYQYLGSRNIKKNTGDQLKRFLCSFLYDELM